MCGRSLESPESPEPGWSSAPEGLAPIRPLVDWICLDCREGRPPFAAARSAALYDGAVRAAIRRLKYSGETSLGPALADFMAPVLAREGWLEADALVPVPLHPRKARRRGYNQAELLARELGRRFTLPVLPVALSRVRETPPQARQGRRQRLVSMAGAFVGAPPFCSGKTFVLIDDVFTTGSTAAAAAQALLDAGARRVFVLTAAAGR